MAPADESLTASSVTHNAATLTLGNYSGNWWLKRTTPADTTCKSKGTTATESLSSLDSNTSYTYKAYSDSNCSTELASETLLTKPGKPTKPVATAGAGSGKLTLTASVTGSGTLTKWQYKKKEGTGNFDSSTGPTSPPPRPRCRTRSPASPTAPTTSSRCAPRTPPALARRPTPRPRWQPADESLTASSGGSDHAATLTLGSYTGNWWLKRTTPADTTCKSKGTTATESLTSLDGNTSYTYTAYSDSNCDTVLASETLLTKPAKPTKPVATAGAGSGKLTLTASVTGSGTLTQWQYQQKEGTGNFGSTGPASAAPARRCRTPSPASPTAPTTSSRCAPSNATGTGAASDASAAVQPSPASTLTASDVTVTTAKLTLTNRSKAWSYKGNHVSCTNVADGTSEVTLTGLRSGWDYLIDAYPAAGCPANSSPHYLDSVIFTTLFPKIEGVSVTAGVASLSVGWTAQSETFGQVGYHVQWKSGNQDWSSERQSDVSTNAATISGLTGGITYTVRVRSHFRNFINRIKYGAWSDPVTGTPGTTAAITVVTLTAGNITHNSATLTLTGHTAAWWYKRTAPSGDDTCHSVAAGTATTSLSSLDSNTNYAYKAYSDSACTSELASESFLTKPGKPELTASSVEATSATLNLSNWTQAWWHKRTVPSGDNTCHSVAAGTATSEPVESAPEHRLHLQGLQRQRLHQRAGERVLPDQARQAEQAGRVGGCRQRQADPHRLGHRRWHAERLAVPAEGGHRQLRFLDRHRLDLGLAVAHVHKPHRRHRLPVQGARGERLGHRRRFRRLGGGGAGRAGTDGEQPGGDQRNTKPVQLDAGLVAQQDRRSRFGELRSGVTGHPHGRPGRPDGRVQLHLGGVQRRPTAAFQTRLPR